MGNINRCASRQEADTELQEKMNGMAPEASPEQAGPQAEPQTGPRKLEFGIEDKPPFCISLILGLQVTMSSIYGPLGVAFTIYILVCGEGNDLVLAKLINTSMLMVGIATLVQVTVGIRLPILQGSSFTYFMPIMAMMNSPEWRCPDVQQYNASAIMAVQHGEANMTSNWTMETHENPWDVRLATISGSLALASLLHIFLGATGLVGVLMKHTGPLTITPTVGLIGLGLFEVINLNSHYQWGIAFGTLFCVVIFSLFLKNVTVPLCSCDNKTNRRIPIFRLFSCVLATAVMWLVCTILTVAGALPDDPSHLAFKARADARIDVLWKSSWFYMPYPGQWGPLRISIFTTVSLFGSVIGSIIESIGDYYATAQVSQVAVPPKHAINRGILIEGLCSVLSGVFGAAHATTSYSNVMGFISYTGNASRRTWQISSVIFILFGMFGKFGAALAMVPQPIIGGLMIVNFGMCFSIAISSIQFLDLQSSRNQMILGISFVLGICMPIAYKQYPDSLLTGVSGVDQAVSVLCLNAPLMAGITGFLLDNVVPGSRRERGLDVSGEHGEPYVGFHDYKPYRFKAFMYLSQYRVVNYIPFLPSKEQLSVERLSDTTQL